MARYRLKFAITGIVHSAAGMHITQITAGDTLTVPDTDQEKGLIEIVHQGRNVSVFIEDLRERAENIETVVTAPRYRRAAC